MGRDYRHRKNKTDSYEDGYEILKDKKLSSYDRNKNRKQNKFNLNQVSIEENDYEFDDTFEVDEKDEE